jgi:hypothetical protein
VRGESRSAQYSKRTNIEVPSVGLIRYLQLPKETMFSFFRPNAIEQLRMMAKLGYIRAQLLGQWIMERTGTTGLSPERGVRVLHFGIAAEATRFYYELTPFSVASHELVLRCFLKLVWEFYRETFGRTNLWSPRGWIEIETLILSLQYMLEVPAGESRETMVAKVLTHKITEVLSIDADLSRVNWVYNYVLAFMLVTKDNLAYTDAIQKVNWPKAKLAKFAVAL